MKLEDVGPEPDRPTDDDWLVIDAFNVHIEDQGRRIKTVLPYGLGLVAFAAIIMLFTDSPYSLAVGFGLIGGSLFLVLPHAWVNRRLSRESDKALTRIYEHAEWEERVEAAEKRDE